VLTDWGEAPDILSPANQIDCILWFFSIQNTFHIAYYFRCAHCGPRISGGFPCHNGPWWSRDICRSSLSPSFDGIERNHKLEPVELQFIPRPQGHFISDGMASPLKRSLSDRQEGEFDLHSKARSFVQDGFLNYTSIRRNFGRGSGMMNRDVGQLLKVRDGPECHSRANRGLGWKRVNPHHTHRHRPLGYIGRSAALHSRRVALIRPDKCT
jgi:hypothetical protein